MPRSAYERLAQELRHDGVSGVLQSVNGYYRNTSRLASKRAVELALQRLFSGRLLESGDVARHVAERTWYYDTAERTEIAPEEMSSYPDSLEPLLGTYSTDAASVSEVQTVELYGPDCIARTADGRILLDGSGVDTFFLAESVLRYCDTFSVGATLEWLSSRPETGSNSPSGPPIFSLVSPRAGNYYHWTTEFLPKVRALRHYEDVTGTRPEVLVDADPPDWKWESLELLGIDRERCEEWDGGRRIVDRLVLPSSRIKRRSVPTPSPSDIRWAPLRVKSPYLLTPPLADVGWVRDTVLSNTTGEDLDGANKVYVSRTDADLRRVVNEPEVLTVLERKGFEPYVLSKLSVAEQAELFAGVDAVVAPHGAGLSNFVYGDDLTVVELFLDTAVRPFFFVHAMERGFDYACVVCEQRGSDMVVDTEELRSAVEAV